MKFTTFAMAALFYFTLSYASAQDRNLAESTDQDSIMPNTGRIAELLDSKTFEFIANSVYPLEGTPKNLVGSGYSVSFSPEMIISNLPFYGRAYAGMATGRDQGMRFKGAPENFTINENNDYELKATVNGESDTYSISMSISVSGYAKLSISSSDRATITYQGEVVAPR